MNARNLKHNSDGSIDMEIEHPDFGWIPFTASPNDPEPHGRDLYAKAEAGEYGPAAPYAPPTAEEVLQRQREAARLSPMEFQMALDDAGLLDTIEAELPNLPKRVQIMWNKATFFERNHPQLVQMAQQLGLTDARVDAVFGIGGN